jgi:DNA gyrase subunit A
MSSTDAQLTRPENLLDDYGLKSEGYRLSPEQAQAILDLRLHRLTGLEIDKIHQEYQQIINAIKELIGILSDPDILHNVIRQELIEVKEQFGDVRRTEILDAHLDLCDEDLITVENLVVTLSREGYIKSQPLDMYSAQHRGGRGKMATTVKEEDYVRYLLVASSHDTILCFSTLGKVYWLKVYQVPQGGRSARGRPIVNLLPLSENEKITAILPVKAFTDDRFVFMATEKGTVKKVPLSEFSKPRSNGKIALELNDDDGLVGVDITDGNKDVLMLSDAGKAIRFHEEQVRPMGRGARGVRGIRISAKHKVISLIIVDENATILTATENGYGQRTDLKDYRPMGRGGKGVIAIQVNDRNGAVVAASQVTPEDEVLLITNGGTLVRTRVNEISVIGRNTQGVRLISLNEGEKLVGMEAVQAEEITGVE